MIAIIDLQSIGRDHIPFNTAFVRIVRRMNQGEKIVMLCRADHKQEISGLLSDQDIAFIDLPAHLHEPPRGRLVRYDEAEHYRHIRDMCRRMGIDHLILLGIRADLLDRMRRKPAAARIDIVFHATLAEPINWRSRNPFRRRLDMFGVLQRRFPANIRLLFLEEGIATQAGPLLSPSIRTAVLPHPIPGDLIENHKAVDTDQIHVGFIGESNPGKGFEHFLRLAERRLPHLELHCIGRSGAAYDRGHDSLFSTPPSDHKLSQAEYDAGVTRNDLIFLPLNRAWYDLVASGTLLDCVRFGVPPVIVRNAVVTAIEQRYGPFGFVVEDEGAGIDLISEMTPRECADAIPRFRTVLHAIAADRTIDAISPLFGADVGPTEHARTG